jgi:hypothetical protein
MRPRWARAERARQARAWVLRQGATEEKTSSRNVNANDIVLLDFTWRYD